MPMNKEATQLSDPGVRRPHRVHRRAVRRVEGDDDAHRSGDLAVTHVSTHCSLREAIERVRPRARARRDRADRRDVARASSTSRGSPCAGSTRTPASTACSATRTPSTSRRRSSRRGRRASTPADRIRPTPSSTRPSTSKRYDAIVCMYHDQGHGPMKLLAFDTGVNVTLGLPIIRTSVDHGTAFDIAWKGVAFTESLDHALAYARNRLPAVLTELSAPDAAARRFRQTVRVRGRGRGSRPSPTRCRARRAGRGTAAAGAPRARRCRSRDQMPCAISSIATAGITAVCQTTAW